MAHKLFISFCQEFNINIKNMEIQNKWTWYFEFVDSTVCNKEGFRMHFPETYTKSGHFTFLVKRRYKRRDH